MSGMVCAGCKDHVTASFTKLEGDKIVGETPRLAPGEHWSYNSQMLTGDDARATGSFHGIDETGRVHRDQRVGACVGHRPHQRTGRARQRCVAFGIDGQILDPAIHHKGGGGLASGDCRNQKSQPI